MDSTTSYNSVNLFNREYSNLREGSPAETPKKRKLSEIDSTSEVCMSFRETSQAYKRLTLFCIYRYTHAHTYIHTYICIHIIYIYIATECRRRRSAQTTKGIRNSNAAD